MSTAHIMGRDVGKVAPVTLESVRDSGTGGDCNHDVYVTHVMDQCGSVFVIIENLVRNMKR